MDLKFRFKKGIAQIDYTLMQKKEEKRNLIVSFRISQLEKELRHEIEQNKFNPPIMHRIRLNHAFYKGFNNLKWDRNETYVRLSMR